MSTLNHYRTMLKQEQDRVIRAQSDMASASERISRKQGELGRATSASRQKQISNQIETLVKDRARAEGRLVTSQKKIGDLTGKVQREEQRGQEKTARQQQRATRELERTQQLLQRNLATTSTAVDDLHVRVSSIEESLLAGVRDAVIADPVEREHDIFLSHASPDTAVARELYTELTARGADVFFDDATLVLGKSQTRQIDRGIAVSRIGVILVTEEYVKGRYWTEMEMGAFISSRRRVIPVLDGVEYGDLSQYSPLLADLVGLSTRDQGFDRIAERIVETLVEK